MRLHELKKGLVFSAEIERFTTYGPEIGAENDTLLAHVHAALTILRVFCLSLASLPLC